MAIRVASTATPESRLRAFVAKFEPANQKLIRAVRKKLRARFPNAFEIVYDNYNFFVIGYSPTERPSDAVISIAASANGVGLCFIHGASLPDPDGILLGSGNQTRFIRLPSADVLDERSVVRLLKAAEARAKVRFGTMRGRLVIRSVAAQQRPRRKTSHTIDHA